MVLELEQVERLDAITARPDLAITSREIAAEHGSISGVVHNIGGMEAPAFTVALVDAEGNVRARQQVGPLAAPLNLEPKRAQFRFEGLSENVGGWAVQADPENEVAEIFEGNNRCRLP
jgi:hypothetical protein